MGNTKKSPKKSTHQAKAGKKRKTKRRRGWVPLGIGSHHTLVADQATFGDYKFKRTGVGNFSITFFDVGCRKKEWPPPIIFASVSGDRFVAIQGWDCKKANFIVYVTSDEGGQMADYDFDWIVYR